MTERVNGSRHILKLGSERIEPTIKVLYYNLTIMFKLNVKYYHSL